MDLDRRGRRRGRPLARALRWGRADSAHPVALDCLHVAPGAGDRARVATGLLTTALQAFAAAGAPKPPLYNLTLPIGRRDDPVAAGPDRAAGGRRAPPERMTAVRQWQPAHTPSARVGRPEEVAWAITQPCLDGDMTTAPPSDKGIRVAAERLAVLDERIAAQSAVRDRLQAALRQATSDRIRSVA